MTPGPVIEKLFLIEWNHLEQDVMHAETVEGFKTLFNNRD